MRLRICALSCAVLLVSALVGCGGSAERPSGVAGAGAALSTNGVNATMSVDSWGAGYCANITLANTSTTPVTSWTLLVALNGTTLNNIWGGTSSVANGQLTIRPVDYDASIAPAAAVSLGFCGNGSGTPALQSLEVVGGGGTGPTSFTLTVSKAGAGSGTVTSTPAGISCGATCSASYASGTAVTLTAAAASGSTFAGWSGACTGSGVCAVSMTAASTVSATFETVDVIDATVSVNAGGAAAGSFVADAGFTGGSTYSTTATIDTSLVPSPVPPAAVFQTERYGEFTYTIANRTPGSAQTVTLYFVESYWTAAGQRTFNVAINGATVLTAFDIFAAAGGANKAVARTFETTANASGQVVIQFARAGGLDNPKVCGIAVAAGGNGGTSYTLTAAKTGNGSGTIVGGGIDCGSTCAATYASGATVTLTATAASGSSFGGWGGACSGTGTCTVTMTANRSVTATFTAQTTTYALTVTKAGTGSGTVTSSAAGINCGSTCSASYASGTSVTLSAAAASGSTFAGWSGACSGTGSCIVTMTAARAVTVTFNAGGGDVVKSAGCGAAPTLTSGTRTIQSGGQSRSFIIRIPDNYDRTRAYRLVFAFHWNGGTANDVDSGGTSGYTWSYYGLRAQANNSTIFVAPQGINNGWPNTGGRDLTFVDDMVRLIEGDLCVDTTRLFAMGFSYGGGMSYEIACARAKTFRAVAVYAGAQLSGCDGGNDPIAYIGFHSISDPVCSIAGGRSLRDRFVRNNGCTAQSPPEPAAGTATHIITSYSGCRPGYPVVWAAFSGPGHTPAPVDGSTSDSGGGDRTWTKAEAWKFFTQF